MSRGFVSRPDARLGGYGRISVNGRNGYGPNGQRLKHWTDSPYPR